MAHGGAASDSVFVPVLLLLLAGLLVGVVGGLVHLRNRLARTRASFGLAGLNLLYAVPLLLSNWGIVGYGLGLLLV